MTWLLSYGAAHIVNPGFDVQAVLFGDSKFGNIGAKMLQKWLTNIRSIGKNI